MKSFGFIDSDGFAVWLMLVKGVPTLVMSGVEYAPNDFFKNYLQKQVRLMKSLGIDFTDEEEAMIKAYVDYVEPEPLKG